MMQATSSFQIMMTPGRARLLSLATFASLAVGYVGGALVALQEKPLDLGLAIVRLVGLLAAVMLFLSNYGQMTQRRESELDEREAQLRNRAYVLTHQIMVALLFLAFFYVEAAAKLGWWLPAAGEVGSLITAFAFGSMALPAAILAWRDQSLPDEAEQ